MDACEGGRAAQCLERFGRESTGWEAAAAATTRGERRPLAEDCRGFLSLSCVFTLWPCVSGDDGTAEAAEYRGRGRSAR